MTPSRALNLEELIDATTRAQRRAADPAASAWVSANAGTGKTHVLTSRVLRLLLAGTKPERILCLTFTKAAAAEMSTRVFKRLAEWTGAPHNEVHRELTSLLGHEPTPAETARARALFALAIETPGGLKVQTIHAFCERLLQRFPLEAGVPPGFTILDDEHKQALLREAIDNALSAAAESVGSPLHAALQTVVVHAVDERFDQLLASMIDERDWSDAAPPTMPLGPQSFADAEASCRAALGIRKGATLEGVTHEILALLPREDMQRAVEALNGGSANDLKAAERLRPALQSADPNASIDALESFFLTTTGEPRKSLMTNPTAARHPDLDGLLTRAQGCFVSLDGERRALTAADATIALLRLADVARTDYAARKARRAALDYDDLIVKAAALLAGQGDDPAGAAQWVHYKLDEGLEHILVDEAQDTNPMQWRVIRGLAEEFFADSTGHSGALRTVFAVGDEKQSIYGFQGAAPHMLMESGIHFAGHARDASRAWNDVSLTLSFRTTTPVLDAVDAVFADPGRTPGVARAPGALRHESSRQGHAGLVEIWESEVFEPVDEADTYMPADDRAAPSTAVRLAGRIADTIARWLTSDTELLESEDRPIRAGDILILVRRRASFAPAMIAALKQRGIPVSGADRMQLDGQIAVQDLIAVGDILLLPEDDLALACVLKSPLIGLDDDDLLRVAPGRPGALWTALLEAARKGDARLAAAAETIKRWRNRADFMPPFEFYAELLDADGGRAKLLARLGAEAADAIDEFLNLALVYDEDAPPSLQGFLDSLRQRQRVIKRDLEHGGNQVRVMTVHGAKGLEAPIVFLPDTCSSRSGGAQGGLVTLPHAAPQSSRIAAAPVVWPVKGTTRVAAIASAKSEMKRQESHERDRLLYVAMTRARDRLYICGFQGKKGSDPGCWYDQIQDGLAGRLEVTTEPDSRTVHRLRQPQLVPAVVHAEATDLDAAPEALPEWAGRRAPREPGIAIPLTPSRLAPLDVDSEGEPVEVPPSQLDAPRRLPAPGTSVGGPNRFLRGTLTHALLQHLPTFAPDHWERAAADFVKERGSVLPPRVRASIVGETLAVLCDPSFSAVFGPHSRAEVAIVAEIQPPSGKGAPMRIAGQIDRLAETGDGILIVDYKTNRPPPRDAAEVPRAYILQLAGYRMAVQRVFGAVPVRAALLWTEGPRIMELPADVLDKASNELFTLP